MYYKSTTPGLDLVGRIDLTIEEILKLALYSGVWNAVHKDDGRIEIVKSLLEPHE